MAFEKKARSILGELKTDYLRQSYVKDEDFIAAQAKSTLYDDVVVLNSLVPKETLADKDNYKDLGDFLDSYEGKLSELYIIIDYVSLCGEQNYSKSNSFKIRELILKYPEINFSFDEHLLNAYKVKDVSFVDFLITTVNLGFNDFISVSFAEKNELEQFVKNFLITSGNPSYRKFSNTTFSSTSEIEQFLVDNQVVFLVKGLVNKDMHSFDIDEKDSILRLCYFNDNLFDASNLRFALKAQKYHNLVINKPNFARLQLSRATNLAMVVEEERSQNLFNCYSAYASGYRSLPVTTASGLSWANNNITPQIILRDYDLQFPDESGDKEIHQVRGWKNKEQGNRVPWECLLNASNTYWGKLFHYGKSIDTDAAPTLKEGLNSVYYISKGVLGLSIKMSGHFGRDPKKNLRLKLQGVEKPVSGVYASLIPMFGDVYRRAIYGKENSSRDYIDTTRKKGYHGVPLDIYYLVKSMVDRAWKYYYEDKRYIHAAVLAQETIEVLNGFHEALLLKAYHILAVSENAIAMNTIGGDEEALKNDAIFRISKIDYEIERILRRPKENGNGNEDRREFKYNILNQIFSDCRKICKEKEHFAAEDCFISAMAHVNEGFTPLDIWHEFMRIIKKSWNNWELKRNGLSIENYD